jgi:hypothetical protein
MVDRHFQEIFAAPKTMAVLKGRRCGSAVPFERCGKLFIAGHILRSIEEPGHTKELELWRLQPDSAVQSCPAKPDRDDQRRSQAKGRDSEEKVMGRSSPGGSGGNMSSFSLQYQVAYSSQSMKEEAAPQIAGRSHLWKKRLHHKTLVENSI